MNDVTTTNNAASESTGYLHRVRWSEVDPQSIVFNSRYLEFLDAATTEFYRSIGLPPLPPLPPLLTESTNFETVLVKTEINYLSSAVMDDLLRIAVACTRVGNSSIDLSFQIFRETTQELLVTATITYVNVDHETRKPATVPAVVRTTLGH